MGLHERYARILEEQHIELTQKPTDEQQEELRRMFNNMMKALFKQDGATLDISILASKEGQDFINTHARTLDTSFKQVEMSDAMRRRLTRSNYIFSGLKTFHELHEAFPSLLDENGNRKPFERFLNDVRKIDKTYNENYLRAEYNFIHNSATMAAKWEQFMEDGDRYNLQYRTAGDDKVRPEHAALNGVTRPLNDSFWESYYPPNGWNCRCTVVQVRKTKYPETPHEEAMALGEEALQRDTKGMFRFNPGKEQRSVPDYNPYTLKRCNDCDIAKGKTNLVFIPDNEVCEACKLVRQCYERRDEVIKHGKGTISINRNINRSDNDFERLMDVARHFAKDGAEVKLTPKMTRPPRFQYECVYADLIGTKFEGKCPDLNVDGKWYEHEGFVTDNPKRALKNMLNDGLKQANRLIIDQPDLTDRYILHNILVRKKQGQDIKEVWIRDKEGHLRCVYKEKQGE